tara:strand:+ start:339 stop:491 length:153 start_codon:yes stop_codon:yes gene_type:complete
LLPETFSHAILKETMKFMALFISTALYFAVVAVAYQDHIDASRGKEPMSG